MLVDWFVRLTHVLRCFQLFRYEFSCGRDSRDKQIPSRTYSNRYTKLENARHVQFLNIIEKSVSLTTGSGGVKRNRRTFSPAIWYGNSFAKRRIYIPIGSEL